MKTTRTCVTLFFGCLIGGALLALGEEDSCCSTNGETCAKKKKCSKKVSACEKCDGNFMPISDTFCCTLDDVKCDRKCSKSEKKCSSTKKCNGKWMRRSDIGTEETTTGIEQQVDSMFPNPKTPLRTFGPGTVQPYKKVGEVKEDLRVVAQFQLTTTIKNNLGFSGYASVGLGGFQETVEDVEDVEEEEWDTEKGKTTKTTANSNTDDDHYGTNNQEDGVEEGDLIVSDGETVYAAYGDYVVSWEARSGQMLSSVQMPSTETIAKQFAKQKKVGYYYSMPYIASLLVQKDLLVVIVTGYGEVFHHELERKYPIMHDFLGTQIRIYNTSTLYDEKGDLELVGVKNVNGRFNAVRAIDGNVHVVTKTGIDTYTDFIQPVYRWNYGKLSDEEYVERMKKVAEKSIPKFVEDLLKELKAPTGGLPKLSKIGLMQTDSSETDLESLAFGEGLINSLVQVFSFDLFGVSENNLTVDVSGSFLPSYWAEVYAAENDLIIACQGWEYNKETGISEQGTYLLGLAIDGPSTHFRSYGHLAGHVLNSYSMDVYENTLRIATTIRNRWVVRPVQLSEQDFTVELESTTSNYVTMLALPSDSDQNEPSEMKQEGRLTLGLPNEVFTAVRFFDNIAYAVTFERTDPFYVLNLDDPSAPFVVGELKITGFSSYLHSMNDDNSMILAIGQEANENGNILGMKITIFDTSDPANPVGLHNYVIEQDKSTISGSEALRNFKAARYALGRLIIPLDLYNWQKPDKSFRGFAVYVADETKIEEECRISHGQQELGKVARDFSCYYCASLPRRGMYFDGLLMTTDKHIVQTTSTENCTTVWKEDVIVDDSSDNKCCGY